ncbi:MAG: gluconate 2-dehydrogenase subunit 3 family protein [Bacteroidota bacterium]
MDRRTALKNLTLSFGYVVSTPTLMSILTSCTHDEILWKSDFFSDKEKHIVTHLADIILPSSNIPGSLDVNVPQFIDKMLKNVEIESKQISFQKGAAIFGDRFKSKFDKKIVKGNKEEIQELFEKYFDLSEEEKNKVIDEQRLPDDKVSNDKKDTYLMYKFLFSVRNYTLFGYYTSEKIGEEILNYDPIPGKFEGCVPLKEIGNAWSL